MLNSYDTTVLNGLCATRVRSMNTRNYRRDEGRPFDTVLQEKVSNHLKRLRSKILVVSVKEKASLKVSGAD